MSRRAKGFGLVGASHILGAVGFHGAARITRSAGYLQVGSSISSSGGMMGLAAATGPAIAALGGLVVAATLVTTAFNTVVTTATEFAGAIAKIGGARGLQEMLIESVSNQKLLNQAKFAVTGSERMDSNDLLKLASNLSESSSAGAFSREDWLKSIKSIGVLSGSQASLSKGNLEILGGLSMVSGSNLEDTAGLFGRLKARNPNMSDDSVINALLAGHAIGQKGSFNIEELPHADKLLQLEGALSGNEIDKLSNLFTVGTLTKGGAGNLSTSGVQFNAFLKQAQLAAKKGSKLFQFNEVGQLTNFNESLDAVVNSPNSKLSQTLFTGRSTAFIRNLREGVSQRAGVSDTDFSPQANEARSQVIRDFQNLHMSLEDIKKEIDESITPQERFRAAFNKIADTLEDKFLQTLIQVGPVVDLFAQMIIDKKDKIGEYFDSMIIWFETLVQTLPTVIDVMSDLGSAITDAVIFIRKGIGGPGDLNEALSNEAILEGQRTNTINNWADRSPEGLKKQQERIAEIQSNIDSAKALVNLYENKKKLSPEGRAASLAEAKQNLEDSKESTARNDAAQRIVDAAKKKDEDAKKKSEPLTTQSHLSELQRQTQLLEAIHNGVHRTATNTKPILNAPKSDGE